MRLDQLAVSEVDAGGGNGAGNDLGAAPEKVLIVDVALGSKGHDKRRPSVASRPAAALGVVRGGRRHVAEVDGVEVADIDPELHCRRTEEHRQLAGAELVLAF